MRREGSVVKHKARVTVIDKKLCSEFQEQYCMHPKICLKLRPISAGTCKARNPCDL